MPGKQNNDNNISKRKRDETKPEVESSRNGRKCKSATLERMKESLKEDEAMDILDSETNNEKKTSKTSSSKKAGTDKIKKPQESKIKIMKASLKEDEAKENLDSETTKKKQSKNSSSKDAGSDKAKKPPKKKKDSGEPIPRPLEYTSLGDGPLAMPKTGQMYMGAHCSGAGGVWNAFADAEDMKAKSFALFLRNQRAWNAKPLEDDHITKWKEASKGMPLHLVLPHGSYLMNLGSPKEEILNKSRNLFVEELTRCHKFGIPHFNFHPGSSCGEMSREKCCIQIAESINMAHEQTKGSQVIAVLENMCKQGNTVGGDFHELRVIIQNVKDKSRVGVCIDTCHATAAGYELGSEEGFEEMINDFGKIVGWQFLRGLHINDSKGNPGDHLDRHENIGKGTIGIEGFRRIMNCEYFTDMPLILETPFTTNDGYAKEILTLECLIKKKV